MLPLLTLYQPNTNQPGCSSTLDIAIPRLIAKQFKIVHSAWVSVQRQCVAFYGGKQRSSIKLACAIIHQFIHQCPTTRLDSSAGLALASNKVSGQNSVSNSAFGNVKPVPSFTQLMVRNAGLVWRCVCDRTAACAALEIQARRQGLPVVDAAPPHHPHRTQVYRRTTDLHQRVRDGLEPAAPGRQIS